MEQKDIVIINPSIANNLLQKGYTLTKIAKSKYDDRRSVFHFKHSQEILYILESQKNKHSS